MRRISISAVILGAFLTLLPLPAFAGYDAGIQGKIVVLRVYPSGKAFIKLENQPTSHPSCLSDYFAIDSALDPNIRAMLLSRALTAKASGEIVNIGYDSLGDCADNRIRIHAIG